MWRAVLHLGGKKTPLLFVPCLLAGAIGLASVRHQEARSSAAGQVREKLFATAYYDFAPSPMRERVLERRTAGLPLPDPAMVELETEAREQAVARQQDQALVARYYQEILSRDQDIATLKTAVQDDNATLMKLAEQLGLPKDQLAVASPSVKSVGGMRVEDRTVLPQDRPAAIPNVTPVKSLVDLQARVQDYLDLPCPLPMGDVRCGQAINHAQAELGRGHGLDTNRPDALPTLEMAVAQPFGPTAVEFEPLEVVNGRMVHFHDGVDLAASYGEPVMAAASGTVVFAGSVPSGAEIIEIAHAGGLHTLYLHEQQLLVQAGQQVQKGQIIGLVGATGLATGPHVHFQIDDLGGQPIDPLPFVR